jgi:integrase
MGTFLRGGVYQYKKQIEKRRYYRSLHIKRGQESMLSARIAQVDEQILAEHFGLPSPAATGSILLSAFIPTYERWKSGKATIKRDVFKLNRALRIMGDKRLAGYRRDDFDRLEKQLLADGLSKTTLNRDFEILQHAFSLAVKERYLRESPLGSHEYFVEDSGERRALTDEEIASLLTTFRELRDTARPDDIIRHALFDLARFGLYTGARLGEIVNLRHDQIDGDKARYKITETKFRKRGAQAKIPEKIIHLSAPALAIIAEQPPSEDGHVFKLRHSIHSVSHISGYINTHRSAWGVPGFSFHWLRHTFITRAVAHGDPVLVRLLVGHGDLRTTLRYTHPDDGKKRDLAAIVGAEFERASISSRIKKE